MRRTLLIAGTLTAMATVYFVALMLLTGPAHGAVIEPIALGGALTGALLWGARRQRRSGRPK